MIKYLFAPAFILLCANVFAQDTASTSARKDSVFIRVDIMPQFPGGEEALFRFLGKNIKYPASAREDGIQGRVYVTFVVMEDGTLNYIDVVKSPDKSLSEEALRVVKLMPKWKPGYVGNNPVRVQYNLPINFTLYGRRKK